MSQFLFPNVAGSPGVGPLRQDPAQAPDRTPSSGNSSENLDFQRILESSIQAPLKFSAHAQSRLNSRQIQMGDEQMRQLSGAVDKAAAKGLDDTLILTKDAAFIVSVKNRTVVTAMDRSQMDGNVFTNIEGAVIV